MSQAFAAYIALVAPDGEFNRPRVLRRWPTLDRGYLEFPPGIAAFALAAGATCELPPQSTSPPASLELTAALTLADGTRVHAASLTFFEPNGRGGWLPRALCLLSHLPLLEQLLSALRMLRAATLRSATEAALVARALLQLPLPLPGVEVRIELGGRGHLAMHSLRAAPSGAPPVLGTSLHAFVRRVGIEVAIGAAEVLISELRLAIISRSDRWLGQSAEALLALLHPLEWPHTYIPLLPVAWRRYIEAPCPFLIGLIRDEASDGGGEGHGARAAAAEQDGGEDEDSEDSADGTCPIPDDV